METVILKGQVITFTGDPFRAPWSEVIHHESSGAIAIQGGQIIAVGNAAEIVPEFPQAQVRDYGDKLIVPGFVDTHVHYPQTGIIASWGSRLIQWLENYTFPEEMRLSDPTYAAEIASRYFDLVTPQGTTTVCSYATSAPVSVTAFFEAAQARGLRAYAGKTCMDRNAPDGLCDTPQRAYDESKALCDTWHGVDRLEYVITPRFAPTSTPEQLAAMGALWAERPECLMQTHLSEQLPEIFWVRDLFPKARDYLSVYEEFGLLGQKAILGHAIHLEERESARIVEVGAAVAHCPTSNNFIGSGLCDIPDLVARGGHFGLATDTGGGSSFSMLRTMAAAYEVAMQKSSALHPAQLLWSATAGGARTLHAQDKIGQIAKGYEADLVVLDLASTPGIAQRSARAEDIWEALFPTIMMGDDRAISAVYVNGELSHSG